MLKSVFKKYPLVSFVILNYLISWTFLYPCYQLLLNAEDILHLKLFEQFKNAINEGKLSDNKTLTALSQLQNAKTALKDLDEFFEHFKSK